MNRYDVVVVGGRVAGASTALLLARAGASVAVVERGDLRRDPVSTHALMRGGVLQLSRWGALDRIVAAGTPPVRQTLFGYPDGELVRVSIRGTHGVDALYAPRRTLLDRVLLELAEEAGTHLYRRTDVVGLARGADGRVVGVTAEGPSGVRVLGAGLVVGADGLRSVVAREVGAPILQQGRAAGGVLYRYLHGLHITGYEWFYGEGAAAGLIPTNDGATCVFVSASAARLRRERTAGSERAFASLLDAAAPGLREVVAASTQRSRIRGWRGTAGFVRQAWGAGWALVGDAGYFKDPISTHGITDALRDADLLAEAIGRATTGGDDARRAMTAYQDTRDRLSRALWEATEEVAGYGWDVARSHTLVRSMSAAMSDEVDHLARLDAVGQPMAASTPDRSGRSSVA